MSESTSKITLAKTEKAMSFLEEMQAEAKASEAKGGGCPQCGGSGYIRRYGQATKNCKCFWDGIHFEKYVEAGVPRLYYNLSLQDWDTRNDSNGNTMDVINQTAKDRAGAFMQFYISNLPALCAGYQLELVSQRHYTQKVRSLLLVGGPRSGKSMLASLTVMNAINQGFHAKFYTWQELCNDLKDYKKSEEQDRYALEFASYDFIAVDGMCDYDLNIRALLLQLDRLASSRIHAAKPIILTANEGQYESLKLGQSWKNLVDSCQPLRLPAAQPPPRPFQFING